MDDSEFYKLFADKMRRADAPDFSDEDWERLTPVLDQQERKRWRVLPLWWLGALSALLLCSNLGWWWMYQKTEKNNDALRQEWQQMLTKNTVFRDTTWSKIVVYQYDTVYQTRVYRSTTEQFSTEKNKAWATRTTPTNTPDFQSHSQALLTTEQRNTSSLFNSQSANATLGAEQVFTPQTQPAPLDLIQLPFRTTYLKIPARSVKTPQEDLVFIPKRPSKTSPQPVLIPKKFSVGAATGVIVPGVKPIGGSLGFSTSLTTEVGFSEALSLVLEGSYSSIGYYSTEYNEAFGLPAYPSPGDDFELKYLESDEELKTVWQFGAGFRYWWHPTRRFSPYLGLGYAAQWHPEYELKLEFINTQTDDEEELTLEVPALRQPVSMLDFNAGLRYQIWRKLYLQTGAAFQFKLDPKQAAIPRYFGLKVGVLYAF